ncbi:MAG: hypothetical protein WA354_22060 [Terracidiphilus sp.]
MNSKNDIEPLRSLSKEEYELLRWMFEHGLEDLRTFRPQLESIRAARSCKCGCPSIRLDVPVGAPQGKDAGETIVGDFAGKTQRGELVGVLLFQKAGRLIELEVYSVDGQIKGDSSEFGLPLIESMTLIVWEPIPGRPEAKKSTNFPKNE